MEAPRILYIITRADIGGAQANVLDLIAGLHARYDVHLATGTDGPLTARVRALGLPVHLVPSLVRQINPLTDLRSVQDCARLIRRLRPRLIHAHSSKAGIVGRAAARLAGVPAIFSAHGWGFSPGTPRGRRTVALWSERAAAPLAARIICVSEFDRRLALRAGVGSRRSLVTIRYGIGAAAAPPAAPADQPPRFVMAARFNEQKDQHTLLRALARVPVGLQLDFAGSGPSLEACRALARRLGVADRVAFLGDRHDVPDLLARAQGFVLSTHYEGLPLSIMEAMRAGLPVVATRVSGIPEEVLDGETGLLVPHGDVAALAAALCRLAEAPVVRRRMGEAGRQRFLREFTIERMLAETEGVYREILER